MAMQLYYLPSKLPAAPAPIVARPKRSRHPGTPRPPTPKILVPVIEPCAYEGRVVTRCSHGEEGHLRQCLHPEADWDLCRRRMSRPPDQSCNVCPLHSRNEIGRIRHLLYFVCPLAGNGVWQWNVEKQLIPRLSIFNGKRICAIVFNGPPIKRPRMRARPVPLDQADAVKAMLAPHGFEFLEFTNQPNLGEVVAWRDLWRRVLPGNPGDAVFYAHAKGVRRGFEHPTSIKWASAMYETNLDYWPLAMEALKSYPIVGAFKKQGHCFPGYQSAWHYSGTFFWTRLHDFARRQWQEVPKIWAGTEMLPGILFKDEEGGCIFHEAFGTHMELYAPGYWQHVVEPALEMWRTDHASYKQVLALSQ